jgi:hypothetical protein
MAETITAPENVTNESDLASLQQLSSGFESFNQVIADNIARAKSIIQEAAAARAQAAQDIADERAQFEQEMADARATFEAEKAAEQARLDGQRSQLLAVAQAVINNDWPESVTPPAPTPVAPPPPPVAPAAPIEPQAAEATIAGAAEANTEVEAPNTTAETVAAATEATLAESSAPAESAAEAEPSELSAPSEPVATPEPPQSSEPTRTTVIVHGIHKPAIATGLQRFLLGQPGIAGVEPREFAEGILRLQVRATVPVSEDLFTGWSDGEGMTVIQRVPQTVEVILPTAS